MQTLLLEVSPVGSQSTEPSEQGTHRGSDLGSLSTDRVSVVLHWRNATP
ncbi:hypothetical protein FOXG_17940 [Fusarium oxysporum f. sp. lycopersici 4287]|uniref:Uncharacterized protein n=2 Tax=Fusarium oxysporum TaxID=5507 RepID=A0A0J9WGF9_FUSO4|nr:hypothetical protein FOXG_17940 [Fusarium oxysporum f. sp. lycopersici 4287]EXK48643.1 hypothetical protein FOMG_01481 [Fusarium oxysporum f. sp. melonis 26406]KNA94961.1 hypothetical protein FOXG_17940 [Fusarium oxysporum f. sp. lycopersici 4287]